MTLSHSVLKYKMTVDLVCENDKMIVSGLRSNLYESNGLSQLFLWTCSLLFFGEIKSNCSFQILIPALDVMLHSVAFEPRREKTGFLHMRKQRRRSASRYPRS